MAAGEPAGPPVEPAPDAHTSVWVDYHRRCLAAARQSMAAAAARADLDGQAAAQEVIDRSVHALEQLGILGL